MTNRAKKIWEKHFWELAKEHREKIKTAWDNNSIESAKAVFSESNKIQNRMHMIRCLIENSPFLPVLDLCG